MNKGISRRNFIRGSAGAVTLAAMGVLGGCTSLTSSDITEEKVLFNRPNSWDYETDLIVVGTGTAMYGAIKAAHSGLSGIAIDAYAMPGGATGFSGGGAWLPMNRFSIEQGDTKEACMTYLRKICREVPIGDDELESFIDNSKPMMEFMDTVFKDYGLVSKSGYFGDYHAEWEGGRADAYRSVSWRREDGSGSVTEWKNAYCDAFEDLGGKIMTSTKAIKYVYSYNDEGVPEVYGIIAEQDGKEISIKAKKGVLMGAGGYEWNDNLRNSFLAVETPYACSLSTGEGTALKMTMALGAELINMSECYGMLTFREKADEQKEKGLPANIVFERYFPRQIIVNRLGRRFVNESASYDSLWLSMAPYDTYGQNEKTNVPAWQIFDRKFVDEIGFNISFFIGDLDNRGVPPYFKEANTIEELAELVGIDKENLVDEVNKWNHYCEIGEDLDFKRGEDFHNQNFAQMRDMTLPLQHNLGPIDAAPYYIVEIAPNTLGTCGGPRINKEAQIMHVSGAPIEGLYGCGNFTGFGGPGRGYPGAGGTIGQGLVFGYVAANHVINNR